jgi:dihydrofolate reductase
VSASVLYMSMSLDGYIAGPNDEPDNPGGDDFDRLHEWFGHFSRPSGPVGELFDEMDAFGAIVVGRRTAEQIDHWGGDRHGVPIFVPSHRSPDPSVARYPLVTYVTVGIESAMAQAKAAAAAEQRIESAIPRRSTSFTSSCMDDSRWAASGGRRAGRRRDPHLMHEGAS